MRARFVYDGLIFGLLFLLCLSPNQAQAYIDPGTGSFMVQILVGSVLGGLMSIKIFWRRITGFVRRTFAASRPDRLE